MPIKFELNDEQIAELQKEREALFESTNTAKTQLREVSQKLAEGNTEITLLSSQKEDLKKEIVNLQKISKENSEEVKKIEDLQNATKQVLLTLTNEQSLLEKEKESLEKEIESLQVVVQELKKDISSLKIEGEKFVTEAKKNLESVSRESELQSNYLIQSSKSIEVNNATLAEVSKKIEENQKLIQEQEGELFKTRNEVAETKKDFEKMYVEEGAKCKKAALQTSEQYNTLAKVKEDVNKALAELDENKGKITDFKKNFILLSKREERLREFCSESGIDFNTV